MVVFNNDTYEKKVLLSDRYGFVKEDGYYVKKDQDGNIILFIKEDEDRLFVSHSVSGTIDDKDYFDVLDWLQELFHHGVFISEFDMRARDEE